MRVFYKLLLARDFPSLVILFIAHVFRPPPLCPHSVASALLPSPHPACTFVVLAYVTTRYGRCSLSCTSSTRPSMTTVLQLYDGIDSIRHLTNFGRSVLGCIEAYDSETRRIFQHFSKSTRCAFLCTTRNSIFCKKNRLFFLQILLFIAVKPDFMTNFLTNFDEILTNFDEILTNGDEF